MKYLREYFLAFFKTIPVVAVVYFIVNVFDGSPLALYGVYVALITGLAGPIALLLENK